MEAGTFAGYRLFSAQSRTDNNITEPSQGRFHGQRTPNDHRPHDNAFRPAPSISPLRYVDDGSFRLARV